MNKINAIMLLCKVVDNYGDIGVVYRLAKSLSELRPEIKLTIICSNLESFAAMTPGIDSSKKLQQLNWNNCCWTVADWDYELPKDSIPSVIIECFQCGRPDWLENILFAPENKTLYHIFNIEYLTAEEYADDFHLLKSYTRSSCIKKMFFMPGFTSKTAGLIIDRQFASAVKAPAPVKNQLTVTLFSYERSFDAVFNSLNKVQKKQRHTNPDFSIKVLAAAGKSLPYAKQAWENSGKQVEFTSLPFLSQEDWDQVLCNADINFIRGEESLARSALSCRPFVWHAYIQDEDYQLVKVNALLDRLLPFIPENRKNCISQLWNEYNTPGKILSEENLECFFDSVINENLSESFSNFSQNLMSNGNLAKNLLNHLDNLCIEKNS